MYLHDESLFVSYRAHLVEEGSIIIIPHTDDTESRLHLIPCEIIFEFVSRLNGILRVAILAIREKEHKKLFATLLSHYGLRYVLEARAKVCTSISLNTANLSLKILEIV